MSEMNKLRGTEACARCGSTRDVALVKYMRGQQRARELWCRRCRKQKLVPVRSTNRAGERVARGITSTTLPILVPVGLVALCAVMLWVLSMLDH